MQIRQLTEAYAVSPQISVEDVAAIKAAGYRAVICNRPDNEDPSQPPHEEIRKAVEAAGLDFRWVPVVSGHMTAENVVDQQAALEDLPGPVLAYCRSGTRSGNLYMAIQQMGNN